MTIETTIGAMVGVDQHAEVKMTEKTVGSNWLTFIGFTAQNTYKGSVGE